jgi:hypothetical protein
MVQVGREDLQDLAYRGDGDAMAEPDQFALPAPVSPCGILGSHPNDQACDRRRGGRVSRSVHGLSVPEVTGVLGSGAVEAGEEHFLGQQE